MQNIQLLTNKYRLNMCYIIARLKNKNVAIFLMQKIYSISVIKYQTK